MKIVSIAGGSGSGKTTYAKKVINLINLSDISILHMDSYYLPSPPPENYLNSGRANFDCPQAFDWNLLRTHLQDLRKGRSIEVPIYDFSISRRTTKVETFKPTPVILFEPKSTHSRLL